MTSARLSFVSLLALASLGATCDALAPKDYERYSSASGLVIGEGDPDVGRAVFLEFSCNACHEVDLITLPPIDSELEPKIALGGVVEELPTDGYLATAVINPSHELAKGYPRQVVSESGRSRMTDYGDFITVRKLRDLVAFLHTRYRVPEP
jgi:hypothetical protein